MAEKKKVYGLILPGKKEQSKQKETRTAFNIFGDDESDDEEKSAGPVGPFGQTSSKTKFKKQNQMDIEKAMMEDPTVYEYDEIYDDMQASKPKVGRDRSDKEKQDKKPRYITGLLKAAEARKKDGERRNERKVQKEREAEGEKFADKESFVTSAYKKKMLEMQEEEEKERREAELEALTDVTKQKDMSGFYRYLYRQSGDGGDTSKDDEKIRTVKKEDNESDDQLKDGVDKIQVKEEPGTDVLRPKKRSSSSSSSSSSDSSNSSRTSTKEKESSTKDTQFIKKVLPSKRNVRQKRPDSSSEDDAGRSRNSGHAGRAKTSRRRSQSKSNSRSRSRSPDTALRTKHMETSKRRRDKCSRSVSRSPKRDKKSEDKQSRSTKHKHNSSNSPPSGRHREKRRNEQVRRSGSRSPAHKRKQTEIQVSSSSWSEPNQTKQETTKSSVSSSSDTLAQNEVVGPKKAPTDSAPVDPSKKVYPHHNSPKDIAEARKRYLARKLERERGHAN